MHAVNLTTEHMTDPIGIDVPHPQLSWICEEGLFQSAYQIRAAAEKEASENRPLLWDSGIICSDENLNIEYPKLLRSGDRVYWCVRLRDETGTWGDWSEPAMFEMGLLEDTEKTAQWINPERDYDTDSEPPVSLLRKEFCLEEGFTRARLYVSSLGMYEAYLNGRKVTEDALKPGFTDMERRRQYQTYDVGALLQAGRNAAGLALADGWARSRLGFSGKRNQFSLTTAAWAMLVLDYPDRRETALITDLTWKATKNGPWRRSDLRDGEWYDARMEIEGWCEPGFDDHDWEPVYPAEYHGLLDGCSAPPVREIRRIKGKLLDVPNGKTVIDFGENIAGWIEFTVSGNRGDEVSLVHGEVLDSDGNFTMRNFHFEGSPEMPIYCLKQEIHYTLKGCGRETYKPSFTFMGFRYLLVERWPGKPDPEDFTAIVLCTDMKKTVSFECSDPRINRLYENTLRSQIGNFIDIPTDCPHRERMGWTGDAQIFCRTGVVNYDVQAFFTKWLKDMHTAQKEDGAIPNTIPFESMPGDPDDRGMPAGSSGWGDAAVIIPFRLYEAYGNKRILEDSYGMMKKWVDFEARSAASSGDPHEPYLWDSGFHWGEWLEPGKTQEEAMREPKAETATAYFAQSACMLAKTAEILGKPGDAEYYQALSEKVKDTYIRHFTDGGTVQGGNRQCLYVRPLALDLIPESTRKKTADDLSRILEENEYRIGTGFLSTPCLLEVLTKGGHPDTAYRTLLNEKAPGWLYPVLHGATTIWETWEGYDPEGQPFASHNHYAFGAVMEWVYRYMVGIQPCMEEPGYKKILIHPYPGEDIRWAKAELDTVRGRVFCGWKLQNDRFLLDLSIPVNTTAEIQLPSCVSSVEDSGDLVFKKENGVFFAEGCTGTCHIVCRTNE